MLAVLWEAFGRRVPLLIIIMLVAALSGWLGGAGVISASTARALEEIELGLFVVVIVAIILEFVADVLE